VGREEWSTTALLHVQACGKAIAVPGPQSASLSSARFATQPFPDGCVRRCRIPWPCVAPPRSATCRGPRCVAPASRFPAADLPPPSALAPAFSLYIALQMAMDQILFPPAITAFTFFCLTIIEGKLAGLSLTMDKGFSRGGKTESFSAL